jgi:hypothetical protein
MLDSRYREKEGQKMENYNVDQVVATLGAFRGETYRRAIGLQMKNIVERIEKEMDAVYGI